jgi:hypothetical protein
MDRYTKDPNAVLDYKFDWAALTNQTGDSNWLQDGETIVSETMTVATGLTLDSGVISDSGTSVTVWLSGGTAGTAYNVTCHIVTSNVPAREDDRTIQIRCAER